MTSLTLTANFARKSEKETQMKVRIYKDVEVSHAPLPSGFLLTVVDAAAFLGVSDESLRRYGKSGRIECVREDGTHGRHGWRYAVTSDEVNRVKRLSKVQHTTRFPDDWYKHKRSAS